MMTRASVPRLERGTSPVPKEYRDELAEMLVSQSMIERRVKQLAVHVEKEFAGREMVVIPLLTGTVMFIADLLRNLSSPLRLDFIGVSSYRGAASSRELLYTKELRLDVRGRDVLLVDDILDTGRTLGAVIEKLKELKPRRLRACVLFDKPARRVLKVRADYVGFRIPDVFVVGYGLDYAERFRNLPFVAVLKPEVYEAKIEV
jgi:hypoxanthine phosphoribosyltransferase